MTNEPKKIALESDFDTKLASKSKINRWVLFASIFLSALLTVVYINNVIAINNLLEEISKLERKHTEILNRNDFLKAETNRLQSPERIMKIAEEQLGLEKAIVAPEILKK